MPLQAVENTIDQSFEQRQLGTRGMTVVEAVRLEIRDGGQVAVVERVVEIYRVFDVRGALYGIAHDRLGVLERVTDVAIEVAAGADHHVKRIGGTVVEAACSVEAAAVIGPADSFFVQRIADRAQRRGRYRRPRVD